LPIAASRDGLSRCTARRRLVILVFDATSSSSAERRAFELGLAALLDGIERRPSRASRTFARGVAARSLAV